jgi:hypothetical protein
MSTYFRTDGVSGSGVHDVVATTYPVKDRREFGDTQLAAWVLEGDAHTGGEPSGLFGVLLPSAMVRCLALPSPPNGTLLRSRRLPHAASITAISCLSRCCCGAPARPWLGHRPSPPGWRCPRRRALPPPHRLLHRVALLPSALPLWLAMSNRPPKNPKP